VSVVPLEQIPFGAGAPRGWKRVTVTLRSLPDRLVERDFWIIQATVIGITVLHGTLEAIGFWERSAGVREVLAHAPPLLLILPITLAGYWYGLEGGLFTGIWSMALAIPNLVLWHAESFGWAGELSYLLVVATIGVLVAIPVERERLECRRAEVASRRLRLLNEVAAILARSIDIDKTLELVATRLHDEAELDSVRISLGDAVDGSDVEDHTGGRLHFPVEGEGRAIGALIVGLASNRELSEEDGELLRAVSVQIGAAVTTARLHGKERDHLRLYVRQVTRAQEAERKRISLDLHDGMAQSLVALCRGMDDLAKSPDAAAAVVEEAERMRHMAEEALVELRRLSRNLRPPILDDLGLRPALEALAAEMSRRAGVGVKTQCCGTERRMDGEAEIALYRIAQEALRNIEKHAEARRAVVTLRYAVDRVGLTIVDNGIGFDEFPRSDPGADGKLGLAGMRERAQLIGGTFSVTSARGEGTTVTVICPA
jgi:signal transduction histidine kinase